MMQHDTQVMTAVELFDKLESGDAFGKPAAALIGMVNKAKGKDKAIQFSLGESCGHWVTIPLDQIDQVEVLRVVTCRDHEHPLVSLTLKAARSPEAKIFAALLDGMAANLDGMQAAFAARQATDGWGDPVCGPGTHKRCYPSTCPNPSGHGTIWCTKCQCEPVWNPEPGFAGFAYR